ncbi:MAG TPA: tetratricopeptide repeat protein [Anaeromyxobacter sp.]|nr:tetratricopeptide repeat protein [Anaeromyxobacter sp.]
MKGRARRRLGPLLLSLGVAAALACKSQAGRLEEANTLRHRGDTKGALERYKAILADLGDEPLSLDRSVIRWKALKGAGDVSYLELGDYTGAVSYYRRIISLYPGTAEAREARVAIGDIYRERFHDFEAAIAQYADVAASNAPEAPRYQLEVAKAYLEIKNYRQARTEARILLDRWPDHPLAEDAQLLNAQAWVLEKRNQEALSAFQALVDRRPRNEILARALEGQAHIYAQASRFDRAIELYERALPIHPNPDAIRTNLAAVRDRRAKAMPARPGDRAAAFDAGKVRATPRETQ